MVKNKIVRFIVPIITCCLVVVACVVPAKAIDTNVDYNFSDRYQSIANGSISVNWLSTNGERYVLVSPLAEIAQPGLNEYSHVYLEGLSGADELYYETGSVVTSYAYDYGTYYRVSNRFDFEVADNVGVEDIYHYRVYLNSFAYRPFNEAKDALKIAFVVGGNGSWYASCVIKYVDINGRVQTVGYRTKSQTVGDVLASEKVIGRKIIFDNDDLFSIQRMLTQPNDSTKTYNGGWILFENLTVEYVPSVDFDGAFTFDVIGDKLLNEAYPSTQYAPERFYEENGVAYTSTGSSGTGCIRPPVDPSVGSEMGFNFITGVVGGFLNTPVLGELTFGGLLGVCAGVAILFWIMKMFAGG